jgi:hypothetical protein
MSSAHGEDRRELRCRFLRYPRVPRPGQHRDRRRDPGPQQQRCAVRDVREQQRRRPREHRVHRRGRVRAERVQQHVEAPQQAGVGRDLHADGRDRDAAAVLVRDRRARLLGVLQPLHAGGL